MINKHGKLALILIILIVFLVGSLEATKNVSIRETELVKFKVDTLDIDNDPVKIGYSPPLNKTGEWQTSYDDAGIYNIKITASDSQASTIEEVILIVEEKNRPPAVNHPTVTVKEGETVKLDFPGKDSDGDQLTYEFKPPFNEEGVWSSNFSDAGSYETNVTVSDGEFNETVTVKITVLDVDRQPIINFPNSLQAYENQTLEWKLDAYDPDGEELEIKITNLPPGAVFDYDSKVLAWTPDFNTVKREQGLVSTILNALRLDSLFLVQKELPPLMIEICSKNSCLNQVIPLTVYNVNRKPIFELPKEITVMETEEVKLKVEASDPDGDLLQYYFSPPLGKWSGFWKTKLGERGKYTISVTATDGKNKETIPLTIKVQPKNRRPSLKIKNDEILANEGELIQFTATAVDPDEDNLTISIKNLPPGASFEEGFFSWTPSFTTVMEKRNRWEDDLISSMALFNRIFSTESSSRWVEVTASDGEFEVIHPVKLTVKNVNQKPERVDFLPSSRITAKINEPIIFHLAAKDADQDPLSYEWSFSFHEPEIKGTDTIERTFVTPGKKKVMIRVNDGRQEFTQEWVVQVQEEEAKPFFDPDNFKVYVIEG